MAFGTKKEYSSYSELEDSYKELRAFRALHKRIFDKESELKEKCEIAENQLKVILRAKYSGQPSGEYTAYKGSIVNIVVQSKYNRTVDALALCDLFPKAIETGLVAYSVNMEMLDKMVKDRVIEPIELEQIITRTPATPAVSYKLAKE